MYAIISNYRLHTTNTDVNIGQSSSNANNVYSRSYFPMQERIEEEEEIELRHINDKNDPENRSYKDIDDDESDVLTQVSATSSQEARSSFLISPYWLQDERLRRGEVDFLSNSEEEFWNYLIGKYLRPIETDEESQVGLIHPQKQIRKIDKDKKMITKCIIFYYKLYFLLEQNNSGTDKFPRCVFNEVLYDKRSVRVNRVSYAVEQKRIAFAMAAKREV